MPELDSLGNIFAGLLAGLFIIIPMWMKMRAIGAKDSAENTLYSQLAEQVKELKKNLDEVTRERNVLQQELLAFKVRVEKLESYEQTITTLKQRLDDKDATINERDAENRALTKEIMQLKDRLHHLELRLTKDELSFCVGCDRVRPAVAAVEFQG